MAEPRAQSHSTTYLWILGVGVVGILWVGSYLVFAFSLPGMKWEERASIGETFGAVNALFAGLAFVAVVITIYLQSQAIKETREDQRRQSVEQERISFENKFFQLLAIHNSIIEGIEKPQQAGSNIIIVKGRQRLRKLYEEFAEAYLAESSKTPQDTFAAICRAFGIVFKNNEHDLAHYFRHIYHIIAFIDKAILTEEQKWEFVKLFRAQLSSHELFLIFYNGLWYKEGKGKFKPLLEKYALFEYMPPLQDNVHKNLYKGSAFREVHAK